MPRPRRRIVHDSECGWASCAPPIIRAQLWRRLAMRRECGFAGAASGAPWRINRPGPDIIPMRSIHARAANPSIKRKSKPTAAPCQGPGTRAQCLTSRHGRARAAALLRPAGYALFPQRTVNSSVYFSGSRAKHANGYLASERPIIIQQAVPESGRTSIYSVENGQGVENGR